MIDYQNWLDTLEVGDKVYCTWEEEIKEVTYITKRRQIDVGRTRYKNGEFRGSSRWDTTHYIRPVTQEVKDKLEKKDLAYKVKVVLGDNKAYALSLEKLRKIVAFLEEK